MKKFIVNEDMLRKNEDGTYTVLTDKLEVYVPSEFLAIGPMDGRYKDAGSKFAPFFSEFALVKNRVKVEVAWVKFLLYKFDCKNEILARVNDQRNLPDFMTLFYNFTEDDFFEIKEIEKVTNHDVKSVEIWVGNKLEEMGFPELRSFVHIGCTSEDITNCAYARMISDALAVVWVPAAKNLVDTIRSMAVCYKSMPMLAHTHGQPATPTTVGKELGVYVYRLENAIREVTRIKVLGKWNGATGNYAAINFAFPYEDWPDLSKEFVDQCLHLDFNPVTTQIESHDFIVQICSAIAHFNRIMSNFCSDMWTYISMEVFKQVVVKQEVGSSTMPHKVNPINFENGEMNFRKSTSDMEFLEEWLMSSRMQRDLRDSTALRNLGTAFAHSYLGIERTIKGLKKVEVNQDALKNKLDGRWEVLAEAVQTVLRKYGISDAYNILKEKTRGQNITKEALHEFIKELTVLPEEERARLLNMRPEDYIGLAEDIVYWNV